MGNNFQDGVTTISSMFPVEDITHKPKRTQAGNLVAAGKLDPEALNNGGKEAAIIPKALTIEKAIKYFEQSAINAQDKDLRILYIQTAKWLADYRAIPKKIQEVKRVDYEPAKDGEDEHKSE